ncbi:MAG: twin-arginine translocation signal domain-containing protein [Chloroflexi bacterium]|nr:twin-arginine translocation signal domain-containing protein [Chloroflexota bacterium]
MDNKSSKEISRRDAMKILAAVAGAAALANLPSKWSKPELVEGVLPAHAQTSTILHTLAAGPDAPIDSNVEQPPITVNSTATITPPTPGIVLRYSVVLSGELSGMEAIDSPVPLIGTIPTNGSGMATLPVTYSNVWDGVNITVTWSFENPIDGTNTDDQIFSSPPIVL